MRRIGLTGGIGSGKSTVAARLAEHGAVIIDADAIAREVVAAGTPGLAAVLARFGPEVAQPDGTLDRPALGRIVFADQAALADLNSIVHPLVGARTAELMQQAGPDAVIVYDVPLLVENGLSGGFDAVVVVQAPLEVRLSRLAGRGMDRETALARIAQQATDEQRRRVATVLLDNSGSRERLMAQVDRAWLSMVGPGLEQPDGIG
ncbi:MAG TPA: dephospho-CoA kinase [Jatrophihabitans sp.]|nr:dephospho-CoA kinase [Jatrophihabitans sp.]